MGLRVVTPKKKDILQRAKKIDFYEALKHGLPSITPEKHELKETGTLERAKRDLMTGHKSQMRQYLEHMADELKLKIVSGSEFRKFERWMLKPTTRIVEKKRGRKDRDRVPRPVPVPKVLKDQTSMGIGFRGVPTRVKLPGKKPVRKPVKKAVAKPKRSRTMKNIRHVKGVKIFSFPDDVWKVREPRRKRR